MSEVSRLRKATARHGGEKERTEGIEKREQMSEIGGQEKTMERGKRRTSEIRRKE
jgi:hypothetical protein